MNIEDFFSNPVSIRQLPWGFEAVFRSLKSVVVAGFDFDWLLQPSGDRSARYTIRYTDLSDGAAHMASRRIYDVMSRYLSVEGLYVISGERHDPENSVQLATFDIYGPNMGNVPPEKDESVRTIGVQLTGAMLRCQLIDMDLMTRLRGAFKPFQFPEARPLRPDEMPASKTVQGPWPEG